MAVIEARRDLIKKLELEKKLEKEVVKINNKIVAGTIQRFAGAGLAFDTSALQNDITAVLDAHYEKTADFFAVQLTEAMPEEISATSSETLAIGAALSSYFVARAANQAAIITETNQRNVDESIFAASQSRDEDGRVFSQREQAREAGVLTARKLKARIKGIVTTETQNAAETSKATEAEVLSYRPPSIVSGSPGIVGVDKEWVTVGDQNVRDTHVRADSQVRDLSKPFTVGGQLLRWPGDTSLGATVENVIHCRCSSVYDAQAVFAIRRKRGADPFTETTPSEQLLESIGP